MACRRRLTLNEIDCTNTDAVIGNDPILLRREIGVIQELLEEQPDSKCTPSDLRAFSTVITPMAGCMEGLVHYKRLLLRHDMIAGDGLRQEIRALLEQLEAIDPARRRRYKDIGRS